MDRFSIGLHSPCGFRTRCVSFAHASIAFSATTGWYRRPSLHLIQPRSALVAHLLPPGLPSAG